MEPDAIEALIVEVAEGRRERAALVDALRTSRVAVLLDRGLEDGRLSPETRPLTLDGPEGFKVLATFSSVVKGAPWAKQESAYGHALFTAFDWAAGLVAPGYGLALNPGYRWAFLITPAEVTALQAELTSATT